MKSTKKRPPGAADAAAAIERAVDRATEELATLHALLAARDAEIERLQEVCDDRRRVIKDVSEHAETYRRAAEERAGLVASLDFELHNLREEFERAKLERSNALAEARNATVMLERQRHEFAVVFAEVAARDAARERLQEVCDERDRLIQELNEHCAQYRQAAEERAGSAAVAREEAARVRGDVVRLERECESLRARVAVFEEALAGRARLIEELQTACDERLALIERLSEESRSLREVAEKQRFLLEHPIGAGSAKCSAPGDAGGDSTDWREVAAERKRALEQLTAEAERRAVLLAEVTAALEGRTRENEELRGRLTRAS